MAVLGASDGKTAAGRGTPSRSRLLIVAIVVAAVATLVGGTGAQGQETILGTAQEFAVLAHAELTNTGPTVINGDLGLSPGTDVTGFPPGIVNGDKHVTNEAAAQAQADAETAYGALRSRSTECTDLTGQTLGQTVGTVNDPLEPGVYCFDGSAQLTGDLYLTGGGEYIFLVGSTLTTASGSKVIVVDPSQQGGCEVFWAVGSSATLGTNSQFVGTIIARTSITATTGAVIAGRLIALDAAVTLDTNTINRPDCDTLPTTTSTTTTPGTTTTAPPGVTTTTATPGVTTTTTLQDGSGPGPTTSVVQGTTTTTVGSGTTATAAPGGGTGSGTSASDPPAAAARSGQALALTGATELQPMVVAGLLAVILGAMMLIPAAPEKGRRRPRS